MGLCILPVRPREKRPYMQNWTKYINTRPKKTELKKWFETLTNPGIGMVTGKISNLVVVDFDSYKSSLTFEDLVQKYPTDMISRTGRGGYHLFYRYPRGEEIGNKVNVLEGVDIRGNGGFVVLPPTIHENGKPYKWIKEGNPGVFPVELSQTKSNHKLNEDKWISELMRGVGEGERNNAAARLAGYFFKKGLPIDVIQHTLEIWNDCNTPPLTKQELLTTIKSISRNHQTFELVEEKIQQDNGFGLVSIGQYLTEYGREGTQWIIDEWVPDGSIVFIVSPPESYKTWILLDVAVSIATSTPFLNTYPVLKSGPVIIIQQEDSHSGLSERLSVIMQSKLEILPQLGEENIIPIIPDIPILIHPNRSLKFSNGQIMNDLEKCIKEVNPVAVIIDPLYSAASVDNYMASAAEDMLRLKQFRDKYGCTFLIAHHSRKNIDPNSTAREDGWGSQFLNAFLETGWQIRRGSNLGPNEIVVRRHSKTMGNATPICLDFDISTKYPLKYHVIPKTYTAIRVNSTAKGAVLEALINSPLNLTELSGKLDKSKSTLSRQLKQLETQNMIQKMPDGRYKANVEDE